MHFPTLPEAPTQADLALRGMFAARKRVFIDLLGWDLPALAGRYEIDQFDTPNTTYLVLTDGEGAHRASARLLRTDRAHLLGELFPQLCDGEVPSGSEILEITRFCIEPTLPRTERRTARNQLITALVQHALCAGITDYTAVAEVAWFRQIAAFGWKCDALGSIKKVGGESLVALRIQIDPETPHDLTATGIYCPSAFQVAAAGGVQ